jgi:F5/8 type C domain.
MADINVAIGKPYTLNYTPSGSYPDVGNSYATDGNTGNWFGVQSVANPTITVDLKSVFGVYKIRLYSGYSNGSYYASSIEVYISNDNINYTKVGSSTAANTLIEISFASINARYVRIKVLSYVSDWFFIKDFQVFGNTYKFLIRDGVNYYSIKSAYYNELAHSFTPLTLSGGTQPNKSDIETFGFDDIKLLLTSMTKGSDTFKPIDKFNAFEVKCYAPK